MAGRNPGPWILALTVVLAAATFLIVEANTDDVSGRTPGTAALIVVAVGIVALVLAQRSWVARSRRAAGLDTLRAAREAAAAGTLSDPAKLEPPALLVALAVEPVDERALVATGDRGWGIAERSQRSATLMTLLIVVLMVPALVLQEVRLIVLAAIPIVLYGVVLAVRTIRPGGTMDQAFAAHDAWLAPLGLSGEQRPDVAFVPRLAGEGLESKIVGPTVLSGRRHGRDVEVRIEGSRVETRVSAPCPELALAGRRQRVSADGPLPAAVARVVEGLGASPSWTGMKLQAGPAGIVVSRKASPEPRWLYDLWLAERIAADGGEDPARLAPLGDAHPSGARERP